MKIAPPARPSSVSPSPSLPASSAPRWPHELGAPVTWAIENYDLLAIALGEHIVLVGKALAIPALVLYSLLILVRNIAIGIREVPAELIEAADGMGYGKGRRLIRIEQIGRA